MGACKCLRHRRPEVRQMGMEVLTKTVDVGNANILEHLISSLQRVTSAAVMQDLLRILAALGAAMDPQVLAAVEPYLQDEDARVRLTAMETVLVVCGDEARATTWLTSTFGNESAEAKFAAYEALRTLDDTGDRCATKVV